MSLRVGETVTIPSPIDVHVHLREPGGEEKETIASGTNAALHGGYQAVFDMPNNPSSQQTWSIEKLERKESIARESSKTDIGFYAGVNLQNPNMGQLRKLVTRTAGLKLYMGRTTGNQQSYGFDEVRPAIDHWMHTAQLAGIQPPILLHAAGTVGYETMQYLAFSEYPIHWCHVSTAEEVTVLERLQRKRAPITAGVTPHHLLMTERNAEYQQGWNGARMMPPLGGESDADRLLWAYKNGTIAILETDHAPHTTDNKMQAEIDNPGNSEPTDSDCFGVSGIEFVLPVMMERVRLGQITLERLVESLHDQPLKMLGLPKQRFLGKTSLKILPHVLNETDIQGKSRNTPYLNWTAGAMVEGVQRAKMWQPTIHKQEVT